MGRSFVAWLIWLAFAEWEVSTMRWPSWLYGLGDPLDRWVGDDKYAHLLGAGFGMCKSRELLARWFGGGHLTPTLVVLSWLSVLAVVLLVEAIEVHRWERWQAKGAPSPWPWLTDKFSLKDIAWGLLGAWMATL